MFEFLGSLKDRLDPLVRLGKSGDSARFVRALFKAELTALAIPEGLSLDPRDAPADAPDTGDRLVALIESAARQIAQDRPVEPYTLDHGDIECLPIFSSIRAAESFAKGIALERQLIIPIQLLSGSGPTFLSTVASYDAILLNPATSASYEFSRSDLSLLRSVLAELNQTHLEQLRPDA